MEKNLLDESIEVNTNLTEEFKYNFKNLIGAFTATYPDYDYATFKDKLSSLKFDNLEDDMYSKYDMNTNCLYINTNKLNNDNIDYSHYLLKEILQIGSKSYESDPIYKNLNEGVSEVLTNTVIYDDSTRKINPVLNHETMLFTKLVNPQVLFDSYMSQNYTNLILNFEELGIPKESFIIFLDSLNKGDINYPNTESILINMYTTMLNVKKQNNNLTEIDLHKYKTFCDLLVTKQDFINFYPHQDFSNLPSATFNLNNNIEINEPQLTK